MPFRRRTRFEGLLPNAIKELIGLQEDIAADQDSLRQDAVGITTATKTVGTYSARYNEAIRCLPVTAGLDLTFPAASSKTDNKWIEVIKLGGGDVRVRATSGTVQGATTHTLTANGFYYYKSDAAGGWWIQPSGSSGISGVALSENGGASLGSMTGLDVDDSSKVSVTATFLAGVGNLVWGIVSGSLALTDLANIGASTWLGNITGGAAPPTANTVAQLKTYIGNFASGVAGLVPNTSGGVATTFLNGAGNFTTPAAGAPTGGANTLLGNPTAASATDIDISMATQSAVIRAAANIINATCAADQALQRLGSADLGFSATCRLLRAPQFVTTTNAAFAHPTGTRFIIAYGVGGGGASGGATAAAGSSGSGGNAGTWGYRTFTSISGTSNVVCGAGGTAGAAGAAGNTGTSSTFTHNGVTLTLPGGTGGTVLAGGTTIASATSNAANAAATNADFSVPGQIGRKGYRPAAASASAISGDGGSGPFGGGGPGNAAGLASVAGEAGNGFGSGASGRANGSTTTATAGAAGQAGAWMIWEFS